MSESKLRTPNACTAVHVDVPYYLSSFGPGPSHTTIGSAKRLLAVTFAAVAGNSALKRAEIIDGIHEELQDTED